MLMLGHFGLVPCHPAWIGALRAYCKTADEAPRLYQGVKPLQLAGAFAVETECVPAEAHTPLRNMRAEIEAERISALKSWRNDGHTGALPAPQSTITGNRSRRDEGGGSADVREAAPGKTIRSCPKGTVGRTAVACKDRAERSGGDPAPIRGPRPNDRGCDAFRRGAGEPGDGQPLDGLPPAHSCRSHSFNRTRVRSFADEAVMTR